MENTSEKIQDSIKSFFCDLLKKKVVDAVLVPLEVPSGENVVQTLVSDPKKLESSNFLAPVMPVSIAKIISDMTKIKPSGKRIGIFLRPCEERALIELSKLNQASLENLILIGIDCLGTYSVRDYVRITSEKSTKDELNLRPACIVCEYFEPQNSDIILGLIGLDDEVVILANSKSGEEILGELNIKGGAKVKDRKNVISKIKEQKIKSRDELLNKTKETVSGLDSLLNFFSSCISCHNCMNVCPICYCRECFFESKTFDFGPDRYLGWANRKGAIKMPTDMILFHITRMNHMVTSCVACGLCEQACPNDIPLLSIFKTVGHNAQLLFDYVPGKSLEDGLPLTTFREDEFEEVGE